MTTPGRCLPRRHPRCATAATAAAALLCASHVVPVHAGLFRQRQQQTTTDADEGERDSGAYDLLLTRSGGQDPATGSEDRRSRLSMHRKRSQRKSMLGQHPSNSGGQEAPRRDEAAKTSVLSRELGKKGPGKEEVDQILSNPDLTKKEKKDAIKRFEDSAGDVPVMKLNKQEQKHERKKDGKSIDDNIEALLTKKEKKTQLKDSSTEDMEVDKLHTRDKKEVIKQSNEMESGMSKEEKKELIKKRMDDEAQQRKHMEGMTKEEKKALEKLNRAPDEEKLTKTEQKLLIKENREKEQKSIVGDWQSSWGSTSGEGVWHGSAGSKSGKGKGESSDGDPGDWWGMPGCFCVKWVGDDWWGSGTSHGSWSQESSHGSWSHDAYQDSLSQGSSDESHGELWLASNKFASVSDNDSGKMKRKHAGLTPPDASSTSSRTTVASSFAGGFANGKGRRLGNDDGWNDSWSKSSKKSKGSKKGKSESKKCVEWTCPPKQDPPTLYPTLSPTLTPTLLPSFLPTLSPTETPTLFPTTAPTRMPTLFPTTAPTPEPTEATSSPNADPTMAPTLYPTLYPTLSPSSFPTTTPTLFPTKSPSVYTSTTEATTTTQATESTTTDEPNTSTTKATEATTTGGTTTKATESTTTDQNTSTTTATTSTSTAGTSTTATQTTTTDQPNTSTTAATTSTSTVGTSTTVTQTTTTEQPNTSTTAATTSTSTVGSSTTASQTTTTEQPNTSTTPATTSTSTVGSSTTASQTTTTEQPNTSTTAATASTTTTGSSTTATQTTTTEQSTTAASTSTAGTSTSATQTTTTDTILTPIPTLEPTEAPTLPIPTLEPSFLPTSQPTDEPTLEPTMEPSFFPTVMPIFTTKEPTSPPTICEPELDIKDNGRFDGDDTVEQFGHAISLKGREAFIGARAALNDEGERTGGAYVFDLKNNGEWEKVESLTPDAEGRIQCGSSVDFSEGNYVVGCPSQNDDGITGTVHIFSRESTNEFSSIQILSPPEGEGGDFSYFGISVAINGNGYILVGASGARKGKGAAYLYRPNGSGQWDPNPIRTFDESDDTGRDVKIGNLGYAVALEESGTVLLGAPFEGDVGAVFIYKEDDGLTWNLFERKLSPIDTEGRFGFSVAINGSTAVVGTPDADTAYVYTIPSGDTGNANLIGTLAPPGSLPINSRFGHSVALYDDVLAVGMPSPEGTGSVFLYYGENDVWEFKEREFPTNPDGESPSRIRYGAAVAVGEGFAFDPPRQVMVGAPLNNIGEVGSGSVFAYTVAVKDCDEELIDPILPGARNRSPADVSVINSVSLTVPGKRYVSWSLLNDTDKHVAQVNLGYTSNSWDEPGTNELEDYSYAELNTDEKSGATSLGISDHTWDCHINHYHAYWWADMEIRGFDQYFKALGWDEDSWDGDGQTPRSEDLYWDDLTEKEQSAASQLCYFRELWDGDGGLGDWDLPP